MPKGERRRARRVPGAIQAQAAATRANAAPADNRPLWLRLRPSFSIFVAFCAGLFVMGLAYAVQPIASTLIIVGLFGTSLGLSRFLTGVLIRRRMRAASRSS